MHPLPESAPPLRRWRRGAEVHPPLPLRRRRHPGATHRGAAATYFFFSSSLTYLLTYSCVGIRLSAFKPPLDAHPRPGGDTDPMHAELLQAAVLLLVLLLVRHPSTFALSFGCLLGRAATLGAFDRLVFDVPGVSELLRGRETPVLVMLVLLLWAPVVIVLYRRRRPQGDPAWDEAGGGF